MTIAQWVQRLKGNIIKIVADEMRKEQTIFASYVSDHFNAGKHPQWNRSKQRYNRPYIKNATKKLYSNSNTLLAAATVKGKRGYATTVEAKGTVITLTPDVDVDVIPYAYIHEYGGTAGRNHSVTIPARPYLLPALEDYASNELASFVDRVFDRLQRASN